MTSKKWILILLAFASIVTAQTVAFQDPDGSIEGVRTVDGKLTQFEKDLVIAAPDPLLLTRFYDGYWRIVPQAYLFLGNDQTGFTGEPFGGGLKYKDGKIDFAKGMVNTWTGEMSGKANLQNNRLIFKGEICEIVLGDGTKRTYKFTQEKPSAPFWVRLEGPNLKTYRLDSEKLPSGNVVVYSYENGNLSKIEMKDSTEKGLHAWIHFHYPQESIIKVTTSDERDLEYHFEGIELKGVRGSHCTPVSYEYEGGRLFRKTLPEGRYLKIDYDELNRVKTLKEPPTSPEEPETVYRFEYEKNATNVFNSQDLKTKYVYDENGFLIAIEEHDKNDELYRETRKIWNENKLKALSLADGKRDVYSLQCFEYDEFGNLKSETLYGNLTGEKKIIVKVDETGKIANPDEVESHQKSYTYSKDGLNLLLGMEDLKEISIQFEYKPVTNKLVRKFIQKYENILKRTFYIYNSDGVCIQVVEDDGCGKEESDLWKVTERHITRIKPKKVIPWVGLPEVVEEKAYDPKNQTTVTVSKVMHSYFPQGDLKSSAFYGGAKSPIYTIHKTYTNLGQIKTETDPEGRETIYDYDLVGNLILTTIPHQKRTIEKKYDLRDRIVKITEKADDLEAIEEYSFDCLGNRTSLTDRFGQVTRYDFDEFSRLEKITYPKVRNEGGEEIEPTVSYTHDIFNNILTDTDAKGYVTVKNYTIRGALSKIFYPDGTKELFKYDPEGSLHRSLTKGHEVTVHEYDYQGRISYQETSKMTGEKKFEFLRGHTYEYNAFRLLSKKEKNLGDFALGIYLHHDPAGRLIKKVCGGSEAALSRMTEFTYDALGRVEKEKIWVSPGDYFNQVYQYDLLGQIKEKRIEDTTGKTLLQRMFDYDSNGNCIEEYSFHNGQKICFYKTEYDPFGESIFCTDSSGNETSILVDYSGKTLRKTVIDPLGTQTQLEFDALGRPISSIKRDSHGFLLASQRMEYDAVGNLCAEIHDVIFEGGKIGVQTSRWIYGPMGRLEKQVDAADSLEEIKTQFTYDSCGRVQTKTFTDLTEPIIYSYDPGTGWLSKIAHQGNSNTYEYDDFGNIIYAKSSNGVEIRRRYNVFGEVVEEEIEEDRAYVKLSYKYDRFGRLTQVILPDRSHIKYAYDGIFGKKVERISSANRVYFQHSYDLYDDQGKLAYETTPIGKIARTYDRGGRKTGQHSEAFSETVQGYNALNCLLEVERKGIFPVQGGHYSYDLFAQLSSENSKTFIYDSLGNCRNFKSQFNSLSQLKQVSERQYFFDLQGNLSKKVACGTETKFIHNVFSQLIKVEKEDGIHIGYLYDPFGRRIVKETCFVKGDKKIPLSYLLSFYWGDQELGGVDEKSEIEQLRVPGIEAGKISQNSVAIEIRKEPFVPIHDISGNVIALIELSSKSVIESYTYSAFGERMVYSPTGDPSSRSLIGNPWGYKEKRLDDETKLIHFGLRLYDPEIHRWITRDPLGSIDGPNQYCFVHNNPLAHFDCLGLAAEDSHDDAFQKYFYGEVERHCYCERHRTCKRGGDIASVFGGITAGIADFGMKAVEFYLQTPLALSLVPGLKARYENLVLSSLNRFHGMVDEGLSHLIYFDPSNPQTLRYKNATEIGLIAFDVLRGNIKDVRKGFSFLKKSAKQGVEIFEKNAKHIFRRVPGHLPDTVANRNLLVTTASNPKNYLGNDKFGNQWHAEIRPDGSQVWTISRNRQIRDGGLNQTPRNFNAKTGLSSEGN